MESVFQRLSAINVNDRVEKKNGLTYLSWAWAWSETKRNCPDATYQIGETTYDEVLGFMCYTSVTIEGETLSMWLPVMDGANKAMRKYAYTYKTKYGEKVVEAATTFDINKTIMRCLVKNLAMFGLGIYIYAGEDLPEAETTASVSAPTASADDSNAPAPQLITLEKDTAMWQKVVAYVTANKEMGVAKIGQQLNRKYTISPELKNEIANLINAQ
jgi:hypothetical protein